MVSLQHFFIRQSRNETEKQKGKKLFIQCQHFKLAQTLPAQKKERQWHLKMTAQRKKKEKKEKRWRSPFCFRGRWTGRCRVCKSISSCTHTHTHTQAHTHVSHPQTGFSVHSVRSGRWSEGALQFYMFCGVHYSSTCLHLTQRPSNVSQNDLNLLGLVFHFGNRWTRPQQSEKEVPIEKNLKIAPLNQYITLLWTIERFLWQGWKPLLPVWLLNIGIKFCPCSLALGGWKQTIPGVYYIFI